MKPAGRIGQTSKRARPVVRVSLRELRDRRALSLSDLAALSGVNRASIHRIEQDQTAPYPKTRRALAEALQVAVDAIAWPDRHAATRPAGRVTHG